jgi:PAS domain S-box-containing protein
MCGNVLCGRFDPCQPFFTEQGSFWTNGTSRLLAATSEADRQSRTRNRCHGEGYESVALIPLRSGGETLGLLQFNDSREGRFTSESMALLERAAVSLAMALQQRQTMEALRQSEERYRLIADHTYHWEFWRDAAGRPLYHSPSCERISGYNASEFMASPDLLGRIVHPDDSEAFCLHEVQIRKEAPPTLLQFRIQTKAGTEIVIEHRCHAVYGKDGRYLGRRGTNRDVTARVKGNKELRENEAHLRLTLEATSDGVWERDIPSGKMYFGSGYCATLGYEPHEFAATYDTWKTYVHPDDLARVERSLREHVAEQKQYKIEFRIRHRSGEWRWILSRGRVVEWDGQGHAVKMIGTYSDISDRNLFEQRLQESESRLRTLFDGAPVGIGVADSSTGQLVQVNPAYSRITGRSRDELCQLDFSTRTHPDDIASQKESLRRLCAGEIAGYQMDKRYVRPDGSIVWGSLTAVPLWQSGASPALHLNVVEEITARKQAEEALRASEAGLAAAQRIAHIGSWSWNVQSEVLFWSDETFRIFDLPPTPSVDRKKALARVHPADRECLLEAQRAALSGNTEYNQEYRIILPNGSEKVIHSQAEVLRNGDGTAATMRGIVHDITATKRAEEEKTKLQKQLLLAQKLESVGQLAGGVAHDFNNLLTVINGYSDLLLRKMKESDPLREQLMEIRLAGRQGATLTKQLLTFSREQIIEPTPADLNNVIQESQEMLQRLVGEDIEVETRLSLALGLILSDPGRLHQVLMNLAANGRDAMPQGGKLTIRTANVDLSEAQTAGSLGLSPGRFVLLQVSDTGTGIRKEIQERIFDPFFTTKGQGKGTGLGLATVYGIVRQSGGAIAVRSESGQGATFDILLPRVEMPAPDAAKTIASPENWHGRETILVAEDRPEVRKLTLDALQDRGYQVLEASEGSEALLLAGSHSGPIHLLLTDVVMPRMTGKELAERLRAVRPETKVLYMSGYAADVISSRGVLNSGEWYIGKPFSVDALLMKVRDILSRSGSGPTS